MVTRRFAVSPSTISKAWRRYQETAVTQGELDRAIEGHQPSSRTGICSFEPRGTGGALPEPYLMTFSRLLVSMFHTKLSETDSMRSAWGPDDLYWDLCSQPSTQQLDWHWPEIPRISRSATAACSLHRWEQVHTKHMWQAWAWQYNGEHIACNGIIQQDQFGGGSVIVWGGISLEGHTDLHVIAPVPYSSEGTGMETCACQTLCWCSVSWVPPASRGQSVWAVPLHQDLMYDLSVP